MKKSLIYVVLLSALCLFLTVNVFAKVAVEPTVYLVKDISTIFGSDPLNFILLQGKLLFTASDLYGREPWVSDGTSAGTELLKDIFPGESSSSPTWLSVVGDQLFFLATTDQGRELWKTDGTTAGTVIVKDINPGPGSSVKHWPAESAVLDGVLYFAASDGVHDYELWRSDGTENGTFMVKDIVPDGASAPGKFFAFDNQVYFSAYDDVHGYELWRSDGTAAGTVMVANIHPDTETSSIQPYPFFELGGWLYFGADDKIHGYELWKTNGSITELVKDIDPGSSSSSPNEFVSYEGKFYFFADHNDYGRELWRTDGTSSGTVMVKDMYPGQGSGHTPFPLSFVSMLVFNHELYFRATDGIHGIELWKTNGTSSGTLMVKDIGEGEFDSGPYSLAVLGDRLYFSAETLSLGQEIWSTDGTAPGTNLVADIYPGPTGSFPSGLFLAYDKLIFGADDGSGSELWALGVKPQDLAIRKAVEYSDLYDVNNVVTYTLVFENVGDVVMSGVVITDYVPSLVTIQQVTNNGAEITNTFSSPYYVWDVADLAPGEGGCITLTGKFLNTIMLGTSVANVATIHSEMEDTNLGNNKAIAIINPKLVFLPLILK